MAKNKKKLLSKSDIEKIPEKEVPAKDRVINKQESSKKTTLLYIIPLVICIIIALVYLFTGATLHWLLIILVVLGVLTMFGWDGSARTCPKCKKWNSVVWIKNERIKRTKTVTTRVRKEEKFKLLKLFSKKKREPQYEDKTKIREERIKREHGKCTNCGHEFKNEKPILF